MSSYLIFSDPHLTDVEIENYRWDMFNSLREIAIQYKITDIVCAGDLVDRKDRHSATLVNRLIEEFSYLEIATKAVIKIIAGNHDKPLNGPYYWQFLSKLGIEYVIEPTLYEDVWHLPFSPNPVDDWKDLDLNKKAIFMHQTGQGATVEGNRELVSHNLPTFPKGLSVFSGDVHRPQIANDIVYIGTPHPVRFSETWDNYVVLIQNNNFKNYKQIQLPSIKRAILDLTYPLNLGVLDFKEGDQIRVRYALSAKQLTDWPTEQEKIKIWAENKGIFIASTEAVLIGDGVTAESQEKIELMKPDEVIRMFAQDEKLDNLTTQTGISILKSSII
jgi:DNA repair exonuclease SbcCD nuclease subunit